MSLQRLGVRAVLFALRFYKTYLSVLMAGSCRFHPTCSIYAYQAVERFGVWRGCWLALKRLLRCHPLSRKFGHDPVPDEWPGSEEAEVFCQGLKPNHDPLLKADLKVRPSTAQQEAHS